MFKFTIRELLLLTLIVAMGLGWFLERRSASAARRSAAEAREDAENWKSAVNHLSAAMTNDGWKVQVADGRVSAEKEGVGEYGYAWNDLP